jgi:glycosyl transferase family 25
LTQPDLLTEFDKIYVINLPSRPDRRSEMDAQLRRVGLGLTASNVRLFDAIRPEDAGEFPSIGARGCFLSHLSILEEAAALKFNKIAILEDDANFVSSFRERCSIVAQVLRKNDWAIFYGGHRLLDPQPAEGCVLAEPGQGIQTTHFLAVRGAEVIRDLANYLRAQLARKAGDARGGPMHVDGSYSWFRREHPHYKTFVAVPQIAYQRASRSDIYTGGKLERVWCFSELLAMLRKAKNRLRGAQ